MTMYSPSNEAAMTDFTQYDNVQLNKLLEHVEGIMDILSCGESKADALMAKRDARIIAEFQMRLFKEYRRRTKK